MIAAATFLLSAGAVSAAPVYFHKADVSRDTFVAEFGECNELAGGVRVARQSYYSPNMYAAAAAAFFSPFFEGAQRRRLEGNVLRTCMADKGYRRVEAPSEVRKELNKLKLEERVERLFTLAASPEPMGKVLPR